MGISDDERAATPKNDLKRIEADVETSHGPDELSFTPIVGDEKEQELQTASGAPSEESDGAMPTVQKAVSTASQGEKMKKSKIAIIMAALCTAVFLAALDMTIITTALPTIASHFEVSEAGYTWIGSAYLLANSASVPLWGKFSDIWGRKPIILVANVVFLVGSLVCALAVSTAMLIGGRVIQGVGGGGLIILVNICVSDLFSMRSRATYFGIIGMVWALASALGPVVGGAFTQHVSWRWCFYINLPCDGLAFIILSIFLDIETPKTPLLKGLLAIDWLGSLTIVGGTVMFLLGLEFGGVSFPWTSATTICLIIFGIVVLSIFLLNEWRFAKYPVMPLRLFKHRSNVAALAVCFCHGFVFIGGSFFLPLYFQTVLAATPTLSGIYLFPFVLSMSFTSAFAGIFIRKTGRYLEPIRFGLTFMTLGFGLFIDLKPYPSWSRIILFQIVAGLGVGPNFQSPLIALQSLVKPQDIATATATFGFIRQLSTSISVVLGGVVFTNGVKHRSHILFSQLPHDIAARIAASSSAPNVAYLRTLSPAEKHVVDSVLTDSLRDIWIFYVCVAVLGIVASLFIGKQVLSKKHEKAKTGLDEEVRKRQERKAEKRKKAESRMGKEEEGSGAGAGEGESEGEPVSPTLPNMEKI